MLFKYRGSQRSALFSELWSKIAENKMKVVFHIPFLRLWQKKNSDRVKVTIQHPCMPCMILTTPQGMIYIRLSPYGYETSVYLLLCTRWQHWQWNCPLTYSATVHVASSTWSLSLLWRISGWLQTRRTLYYYIKKILTTCHQERSSSFWWHADGSVYS